MKYEAATGTGSNLTRLSIGAIIIERQYRPQGDVAG